MCTNSVNRTGSNNIVMRCQQIFVSDAFILKVILDGLDLNQVKSLDQRMDVYQGHLLLPVIFNEETTHHGWDYNVTYIVNLMCN